MLFDNTIKWVDSFVPMDTEVVEGSKSQAKGSKKRKREELESNKSKKQKIDENVEDEVDDEAEMKKLIEIVLDDEGAIDALPLATKSPIIVDWKIIKEGKMGYFQIIRADGSSRRYSSMIRMLQNIDREDLEILWKLVKAKHGNIRPDEAYERVLCGDLKVMFEPDVKKSAYLYAGREKVSTYTCNNHRNAQQEASSCTHWKELLSTSKLMTKQLKNPGSHTKADNDLATATFPFLSKVIADPHAPINALLSKKPRVLQRPAPTRTHVLASSAHSQKANPSFALVSQLLSPPFAT
ncbi:hypothetical protein Tco_1284046 [Tanacetum coccineum]